MNGFYSVEKIIGRRVRNGEDQYLLKWVGYPRSQATWEPVKNLKPIQDMIDEYENKIIKPEYKVKKMLKEVNELSVNERDSEKSSSEEFSNKKRNSSKQKVYYDNSNAYGGPEDEYKDESNLNKDNKYNYQKTNLLLIDDNEYEKEKMKSNSKVMNSNLILSENRKGSLEFDIPNSIISARIDNSNIIILKVSWKARYDKTVPEVTEIKSKDLAVKFPLMLIDFYEKKLKPSSKNKSE